jgi:hypothetical protein
MTSFNEKPLSGKNKSVMVVTVALGLLFVIVAVIEYLALKHTNGVFCYPLDDTFIHLALAKNVANYGVWGTTRYAFQSASSSLLWTSILSVLTVFSSNIILFPFILNIITGTGLIIVIQQWLNKQGVSTVAQLIILIVVILFTPLPILIVSGMEHTFQCLVAFLFVYTLSEHLAKINAVQQNKWALPWYVYLYGVLLTAIRFEGMFLIFIAGLLLLYYKKIFTAIKLGIISIAPIVIFGIYSVSKGSYFFPNSVLLKSNTEVKGLIHSVSLILFDRLSTGSIEAIAIQRLFILLPLIYLLFNKQMASKPSYKLIIFMVTFCALLHLSFAAVGWFTRYEAYLMLMAIPVAGVILFKYGKSALQQTSRSYYLPIAVIAVFLVMPAFFRVTQVYKIASKAIVNIYDQQYQMGQFLKQYYPTDNIAANDIGCTFYFTKGNNIDLWGLSTFEIAKSKREHYYSPQLLYDITKRNNIKVAIIYDSWFNHATYDRWNRVATWTIPDNKVCGDSTVTFYSMDKINQLQLQQNLRNYQGKLPKGVRVKYF